MNCEGLVTAVFRKCFLQPTQVLFQIVAEWGSVMDGFTGEEAVQTGFTSL